MSFSRGISYGLMGGFLARRRLRGTRTLVYQMGKVGSSSIQSSVSDAFQLHTLCGLSNKYFSLRYTERLSVSQFASEKWCWKAYQSEVKRKLDSREIKRIVSAVRDPIARNVSAYFQPSKVPRARFHLPEFLCDVPHHVPLYWFQGEFENFLGVDIYQQPFDRERGYARFTQGGIDYLVYQCERLDELEEEISDFLGAAKLTRTNIGGDKWYGDAYRDFTQSVQLPDWYLDWLLGSDYTRFFYSKADRESMRARWAST